jgi:hypothetical protein
MALYQGDFSCDSCSAWFDGDAINLIGRTPNLFGVTNPDKVKELTYFWLCADCRQDYPNGVKDYFSPSYFENDEDDEEEGYDWEISYTIYSMCSTCGNHIQTLENDDNDEIQTTCHSCLEMCPIPDCDQCSD